GFIYGNEPGEFPTDTLKAFRIGASQMRALANGQSDAIGAGYQGGNIVISANGSDPSTGIVWASLPEGNTDGLQMGRLRAYHAWEFSGGLFQALWSNEGEDYSFARFNQPLVANGKVFLPTFSGAVVVYGLLPEER